MAEWAVPENSAPYEHGRVFKVARQALPPILFTECHKKSDNDSITRT